MGADRVGLLRALLRWTRRSVALLVILTLLAANALSLFSTAFVGAVSTVASTVGATRA